ncbi:MAG: NAD-dependent epimerase/dehydratase family protein [Nitrospinae bacterium]|nr:NAD-dependent epimerase/dehydratase family protein [Nitrospinota bacterium]
MKALVTGASGGLGNSLLRRMVGREGLEVRALAHRSSIVMEGCEIVRGDLRDRVSLLEAVKGVDTVVHLAALTHTNRQEDYFIVNAEGTKNLVDASLASGVRRFMYVSSLAAQPGGGSYSESKLMAEGMVKSSGLKWIVFRPAEVYGVGSGDAVNKLVGWVRDFKVVPVAGDGSYTLSPAFIDDVVSAMIVAVENAALENTAFTLAGPEPMTYIQLVDRIGRFLGVDRYKIRVPILAMKLAAEVLFLMGRDFLVRDQIPRLLCGKDYDIELAVRLLNYRPRKLEEGLRQCVSP